MPKPFVTIASLGGTISMTLSESAGGVIPRLDAAQLVASVPALVDIADISAKSLLQVPSASLTLEQLRDCLEWAERQVAAGAQGVVLTQGTDTIEETAFFLDMYWRHAEPLVVMGAMRTPFAAGADGPSNLLASVQVAADVSSRNRGVLVVMNDTVHRARCVTKSDALSLQTFVSPNAGMEGRVVEGRPQYFHAPAERLLLDAPKRAYPKVALLPAALGDEGELALAAPDLGFEGVVISGFGAGHVSACFAEKVNALVQRIPLVIATRTGAGTTASRTYGFVGSEVDLARRGAVLAGWLSPYKARLLLAGLIAAEVEGPALRQVLDSWGKLPS